MKINTTKLVVGVLAVAGVASLVGSISGTVAWFQYNTRTVTEFEGTTAKCTEFLQVRTVKAASGDAAAYKGEADPTDLSAYSIGDKIILNDGTVKEVESDGGSGKQLTTGTAATTGAKYKVDKKVYKWNGTTWEEITVEYGEWGVKVDNDDILEAAGRTDGKLAPVTAPGATVNGALPTLYGHPICGHEKYEEGDYKWKTADASDYMEFKLQFRVLDIDGKEASTASLYAKPLYLTDLTIQKKATTPATEDISSAVRVHIANGTSTYAHLGKGANNANISTATTGSLDLNLDGAVDTLRDVPGSHYSFNTDATPLAYGSDSGMGTSAAYSNLYAANGLYPTDSNGVLSGGTPLGTTNGTALPTTDAAYFTLSFTIYLEGWQPLDNANASAATTVPAKTIWDSASYINSEFNIGMSFGVSTLD